MYCFDIFKIPFTYLSFTFLRQHGLTKSSQFQVHASDIISEAPLAHVLISVCLSILTCKIKVLVSYLLGTLNVYLVDVSKRAAFIS